MTHEPENRDDQEWEVEDVEVERPVSVVVSVRLPAEVGERVAAEAAARGVGLSAFVRDAVTQVLDVAEAARSNFDWTVTSPDVSVSFYAGRAQQGRTAGGALTLEEALVPRQ